MKKSNKKKNKNLIKYRPPLKHMSFDITSQDPDINHYSSCIVTVLEVTFYGFLIFLLLKLFGL